MKLPPVRDYYGVDFSGAKQAGENIWVAHVRRVRASGGRQPPDPSPRGEPASPSAKSPGMAASGGLRPPLALISLHRLSSLAGTAERTPALAHLVKLVLATRRAVWGFDFPFGLPVELFPAGTRWADQFDFLHAWGDEAYACGLECVARARLLEVAHHRTTLHCRRVTDVEAKAPFDTFHYRIIFQTFFGMRDVVDPLRRSAGTAVLPFQYRRLPTADRVVMECCPSSVLKKLGLPHQNYKQPAGGPLLLKRRRTRHAILAALAERVQIEDRHRRVIMRNGGGDALDAVIAATGAAAAFHDSDHAAIARHPRYKREGHLYR